MTLGISIEKQGLDLRKFYNVYYTGIDSIEGALDLGELLATAEKQVHGNTVTFNNIHVWQVGATPPEFNNRGLSGNGVVSSPLPTPIELCMNFEFPALNSYPSAKFYRVNLDSALIAGRFWSSALAENISDCLDILLEQKQYLCNRNGVQLDGPTYNGRIAIRQYNKRWYNKGVSVTME